MEDVPHPDVLNVINECLRFQGNKRLTFKTIEHRLKIALDECIENSENSKKERRRIKDLKKDRRIKRREDEARKKATSANNAKKERVVPKLEEKNATAIDVKPIESGEHEMEIAPQQEQELRSLLKRNNIERFYDKLVAEGIRSKEDLVHLTVEDLIEWGLGRFEARKAVAAVLRW
jgi:hypothetical protein